MTLSASNIPFKGVFWVYVHIFAEQMCEDRLSHLSQDATTKIFQKKKQHIFCSTYTLEDHTRYLSTFYSFKCSGGLPHKSDSIQYGSANSPGLLLLIETVKTGSVSVKMRS